MEINNYNQILEWINSIRAIYGAMALTELAKGQACNGNHCPLANSLVGEEYGVYQADISYDTWTLYLSYELKYEGELGTVVVDELEDGKFMYRLWGKIPDFIRFFLVEIDYGEHPELAEPRDTDDSHDEDFYEQTFISKREWFFEEEDEEWEPVDIYDFYDADEKGMFDDEDEEWGGDDWMDTDYYIWDY